jgi:hypothetical protein
MPRKDPTLLSHAKTMRSEPTGAEAKLWQYWRAKRLNDVKFSRQVLTGRYIADFAARSTSLRSNLTAIATPTKRPMTITEQKLYSGMAGPFSASQTLT